MKLIENNYHKIQTSRHLTLTFPYLLQPKHLKHLPHSPLLTQYPKLQNQIFLNSSQLHLNFFIPNFSSPKNNYKNDLFCFLIPQNPWSIISQKPKNYSHYNITIMNDYLLSFSSLFLLSTSIGSSIKYHSSDINNHNQINNLQLKSG